MCITRLTRQFTRVAIAAAIVAATTAIGAQQPGTSFEVVSTFEVQFFAGRAPSSLRQANDGAFYGTTLAGGAYDRGTLFRMDAAGGAVTPVYDFTGGADGAAPSSLVKAADGRFYGLTPQGGASGFGTVFRFVPGSAPTTVHSFSMDDRSPVDLFAASDGNIYGLTAGGGDFDHGTIFVLDPGGGFTTSYSFPAGSASAGLRSLVKASDGRFYVTAEQGGDGDGTLLSVDEQGVLTILHEFSFDDGQGYAPIGLIQGRDGRLYGVTRGGGEFFDGTVYSISLGGDYQVLHSFRLSVDGSQPGPDLLEASDGNFYGVTSFSARLFRIDAAGTSTTLHSFTGDDPGELIQAADGRLFGPTQRGGVDGGGTIYAVPLSGGFTSVHEFRQGDSDGRPNGVIQASNGQFYGTTRLGTPTGRGRTGTVFAMDDSGTRTTLHTFQMSLPFVVEGRPLSNLVEATDGNLYGTTFNEFDAPFPPGQIFRITPAGAYTTVSSSYTLRAGLIQASDGRLYGTSAAASDPLVRASQRAYGTVFRVETSGTRTVLHQFEGADSGDPIAEVVEIDDGTLHGTTIGVPPLTPIGAPSAPPVHGTIFRVDPATGAFTTRHTFTGLDGSKPVARLIQASDGLIYGTTSAGGASGLGTVFVLDAAGTLTTLHHFAGPDGSGPVTGLTQGLDGRLYGTTSSGGAFGYGTVFAMSTTGEFNTVHDFAFTDGANPNGNLIQASDDALYGTANAGGPRGGGVVFRLGVGTAPPPSTDGYFEIVSRNSGKCLDVFGASTDAGAFAIQWICHGGANQQWRLAPAGGGAFRIIARHSGQALDVLGALLDDVTPIIQWPVHSGDNQVWTLEPAGDGYVRIVARHSGKAMDVEFASTDDGARVIQYTPHGGANQQWLLRPVE
jgi:uncharacterized repeat protein (TIGR03803 family)